MLRSVDGGANWSVLDDIHFPRAPVFDLVFHNGELRAATFGRGVFSFVKPTGPVIAVGLQDNLAFGIVCQGSTHYLTIEVYNVGVADLVITSVQRLMGSTDFTVLANPGTPLSLAPGEDIEFTVAYYADRRVRARASRRSGSSRTTRTLLVVRPAWRRQRHPGNGQDRDGDRQFRQLRKRLPRLVRRRIAHDQQHRDVPAVDHPTSRDPRISSRRACSPTPCSSTRAIRSTSSSAFSRRPPIGPKAGAITIFSNDPAGPHVVPVSGDVVPAPKANLIIADAGSFGDVCVGSFVDEPLIVTNSGKCAFRITGISSSAADFLAPEALSYPITVGPGDALPVPIRFKPLGLGSKAATITVTSDDPASPISVNVSGDAPPGRLTVTGSTTFGGVTAGCCADRTLWICNTGECALDVTSVHFRRRSRRWRLLNNPFPATLRPGSCLPVVIQYRAGERCPRPCELVIESDDPVTPVRSVEVLAYTIWERGCKEGCDEARKDDCDDCRKSCCDHPPCRQGYPCCDDDDDDFADGD